MYDELVAWLRSWSELPAHCECYESCGECDKQDLCATFTNERIITKAGEAADAIEELSKPRWISVEERLPDFDETVVTTDGIMQSLSIYSALKDGGGVFVDICVDPKMPSVTHWMPLPEPPKEET